MATDGFDALRDQNLNGDSVINSSDTVFSNLRLWRDLNQDGISQSNELTTLAQNNIVSINLNSTATNINLGNGNVQTAAGTFTRNDGTTSGSGITSAVNNLDLQVDTFTSQFTDQIPLTAQALALPTMHGSGQVRDLNEAISLSPALGTLVENYAAQTTRQGQVALLDTFMDLWTDTSTMQSLQQQAINISVLNDGFAIMDYLKAA